MRLLPAVRLACVGVALAATALAAEQTSLRIVVISGEDAVNIIQQKTAVAPIVEVRDRNNLPVAGATVVFAVNGPGATFAGAPTLTVVTDAAGQATAAGLTPSTAGAVRISATATFQGQTATATIAQSNVMSAADAARAARASSAGSSGGVSAGIIAAIVGGVGAAGGAAVALGKSDSSPPPTTAANPPGDIAPTTTTTTTNRPPNVSGMTASRSATIVGLPMSFTATASDPEGDALTFTWDFGDGSPTSTLATPTHTYQRAGQFVVRVTVQDRGSSASAELPVRVNTLTGVWRLTSSRSEDGTLTLTQTSPSSFSGTRFMILFGQRRDCPFTGTIATTAPFFSFSEGTCGGALPGRTFPLELSDDTNTLTGTVVIYVWQRQ